MKTILQSTLFVFLLSQYPIIAQNNALNFDGINDDVMLAHFERPNIFTIELWIKGTKITSDVGDVLAWATSDISRGKFTAEILTQNGYIGYAEYDGDNFPITPGVFYADGNWHHIAVTRNEEKTGNLKFYFDGALTSISTININVITDNLKIGCENYNNQDIRHFKGSVDELRIWNYEKTQTQLQDQMNREVSGDETGLLAYYNFNQGVANYENSTENKLIDRSPFDRSGNLHNFALVSEVSNWVEGADQVVLSVNSNFNMTPKSLSIFPNPSKDFIHVTGLRKTENYEIFDSVGKKIKKGITSKNKSIHIESFSTGNYFLKLGDGKTIRFIKE